MNNTCPNCGAVYNVAAKDVGRKIRCKKCGTPLVVAEEGLVSDEPEVAAAPRRPAPVDDDDVEETPPRRSARGKRLSGLGSLDFMQVFKDFGGAATVLFGFGAFLVIVFLFQPIIGAAAVQRAQGSVERIDLEWKTKERQMRKDKKSEEDINTAREKFFKDNDKERAEERRADTDIDNKRARWMEMYGMMFGFLFLMAGSIGFMMPGQSGVRRVVGAIVVTAQMLIIFLVFAVTGAR